MSMARPRRPEYPGSSYHVTYRGHERKSMVDGTGGLEGRGQGISGGGGALKPLPLISAWNRVKFYFKG